MNGRTDGRAYGVRPFFLSFALFSLGSFAPELRPPRSKQQQTACE